MTPVAPADPRIYDVLAEDGFAGEPFNPRQHESCELMDRYVTATAVRLLDDLELTPALRDGTSAEALFERRGFVAGFRPALRWLLATLVRAGVLAVADERYAQAVDPPSFDRDAIRAAVLASDFSYEPAVTLVDEAAAMYPRVARGEVSGEHALFRKLALWTRYFHNDNRYYALNNRVAARAAADRVRPGASVLEVGAGLGSATAALLDLLGPGAAFASYRFTEPVVFFRRRAQRELEATRPALPWTFDALDLNAPWADQGVASGSVELVWGVNVFHLARDLGAVLAEARDALAPGGWLVVGEGVRPTVDAPAGAEFPFLLLESFTSVKLDAVTRPTAGFLTAEHWQRALAAAGFADVTLVPDVVRLRAIHPGFYATAICGRRG
jgi:SAM-dependent methyltransferase